MKGKTIRVSLLILALGMVLGGCGEASQKASNTDGSASDSNQSAVSQSGKSSEEVKSSEESDGHTNAGTATDTASEDPLPAMSGTFYSMIWGEYTYDEWITTDKVDVSTNEPVTTYKMDYGKFSEETKFVSCTLQSPFDESTATLDLSVLPFQLEAFPLGSSEDQFYYFEEEEYNLFQTIWGGAMWNIPYHNEWELSSWEKEVHDAYLERYDNDQYWGNYKYLMNQNIIQMWFLTKEGESIPVDFLYQMEGKLIHLYEWKADPLTFELTQKEWATMEFSFDGKNLMLRRNGCTLTLVPKQFNQEYKNYYHSYPNVSAYANDYSATYLDIDGFYLYGDDENLGGISFAGRGYGQEEIMKIDDATITLQWKSRWIKDENGYMVHDDQPGEVSFNYIYSKPFGIILVKDGKYYRYQHDMEHYYDKMLGDVLVDGLDDLSDDQKDDLILKQKDILEDLQEAFQNAGINAEIDPNSGKVTLDSSILFAVNDDTLSNAGKDYLDRFLDVYGSVVMSEKYEGTISEILVEGHTDTDGAYDYNMDLSERRAAAVVNYCLEINPNLEDRISSKGCSYDFPIYDATGKVNKAASRRVVFKFKLRVD